MESKTRIQVHSTEKRLLPRIKEEVGRSDKAHATHLPSPTITTSEQRLFQKTTNHVSRKPHSRSQKILCLP